MQAKYGGDFLASLISMRAFKSLIWNFYEKSHEANSRDLCIQSLFFLNSFCNQAKFNETTYLANKLFWLWFFLIEQVMTVERKIMFQWKTIQYTCYSVFHILPVLDKPSVLLVSSSILLHFSKLMFTIFLPSD